MTESDKASDHLVSNASRRLETTYTSLTWSADGATVTKTRKPAHDARRRHRYEHRVGRLLTSLEPPVLTPQLRASNCQARSLTFDAVDADPAGPKYTERDLDCLPQILGLARALRPFNPRRRWFRRLDPARRLDLAVRAGLLDDTTADDLLPMAQRLRRKASFAHGDLTPRNVLIAAGCEPVLIDWEWAGLYPPNYDEGFLWFTLLQAPAGRADIEQSVDDPAAMLMSALLVQLWHLHWYVTDQHRPAQLQNLDEILERLRRALRLPAASVGAR